MRELQLKHIAPYFPFGVKLETQSSFRENKIIDKWGIRNFTDYPIITYEDGVTYGRMLSEVKPLLVPLSKIITEIELNGEKFIPLLKLVDPENTDWDNMIVESYNPFPKMKMHHEYYRVHHKSLGEVISVNPKNIRTLPYNLFEKLIEWHMDLFNLIPDGLAIDKTLVNK